MHVRKHCTPVTSFVALNVAVALLERGSVRVCVSVRVDVGLLVGLSLGVGVVEGVNVSVAVDVRVTIATPPAPKQIIAQ